MVTFRGGNIISAFDLKIFITVGAWIHTHWINESVSGHYDPKWCCQSLPPPWVPKLESLPVTAVHVRTVMNKQSSTIQHMFIN
jgi:hypothetical protein